MSGIAGEINQDINYIINNQEVYKNMQCKLKRRGPDRDGMYVKDNSALIHTLLAAGNTENDTQPMIFNRGSEEYVLVYDGRLYNTAELRRELELLGHKFTGSSDTEVVGHAYIEWKCEAVEKFNGVFAFAVWESHSGRLFMARDRMGVKPFFYAENGRGIIFASEIKALLEHPAVKPDIDANSIADIMLIGPGRTPGYGVFRKIKELEPASYAVYKLNSPHRLCQCRYWDLTDKEHRDSFEQTVEKVRYLVLDSIERQLVSDVPVCTFLSGGLDSSIISSVADRYFRKKGLRLHTFSVDYKDNEKYFTAGKFQPNSDREYIERMTKYLSAEHHWVILDTDRLVNALYSAVDARDLPGMADIDSSLLCFCEDIKKHAAVAVSGECSDELTHACYNL